MSDVIYYLDDYADETLPCEPRLQAWARWLASDDQEWRHDIPAVGEIFEASRLFVLGDIRAIRDPLGAWSTTDQIPEGTSAFFLRHYEGSQGWDAEHSGETIEDALQNVDPDNDLDPDEEDELFLACVKDGGSRKVRYELDDDGQPTLIDVTDTLAVQ